MLKRSKKAGVMLATMTILAAGLVAMGPASPASAASCTAQARGGINSNTSHWVTAKTYLCSGQVRAQTKRLNDDTPPSYTYGSWGTISTATSSAAGTRAGGGVYSDALNPDKFVAHSYYDAIFRNITFTW
jgi:hypothetical protein